MAIARTGVYVDDYLECKTYALPFHGLSDLLPRLRLLALTGCFCVWNRVDSSTLAGDLQRILSTMRELDDRAHGDDLSPFLVFLYKNNVRNFFSLLLNRFVDYFC